MIVQSNQVDLKLSIIIICLWRKDATLGECVANIGNESLHPLTQRNWQPKGFNATHGARERGFGFQSNFSRYRELHKDNNAYPLWTAEDIRTASGGEMIWRKDGGATGYHLHNFFTTLEEIHFKYTTYTHGVKSAMKKPIWEL